MSSSITAFASRIANSFKNPVKNTVNQVALSNLKEAYECQSALAKELGLNELGWKLSSTFPVVTSYHVVKKDLPLHGRIFKGEDLRTTKEFSVKNFNYPRVEPQLCFKLGETIKSKIKYENLLSLIESVSPGFEITDTRFDKNVSLTAPLIVADNLKSGVLFVGDKMPNWQNFLLTTITVKVDSSHKACNCVDELDGPLQTIFTFINRHLTEEQTPL